VCVHQFLHCFDRVLQPVGLLRQQRMLALQMGLHIGGPVIEQRPDLVECQPDRPVHQHQVQPFDVGIGVAAVTGGGTVPTVLASMPPLSTLTSREGQVICQSSPCLRATSTSRIASTPAAMAAASGNRD
jgi:hypothetical protein